MIYLSQNSDETLAVIDGNQRLNSIKLFADDGFNLTGLTAYPELEGYSFSSLDPRFQRHIQNRTIRCIVILKDTHPQIKFDVFERLNTGSVKLTSHELRHGILSGTFMSLLEDLGDNKLFRDLTLNKSDKRMKADELALRFFALADDWRTYTKPLVSFLNNYTECNRNINDVEEQRMRKDFFQTLSLVNKALEKYAFKTYDRNLKNTKFNAALFDAQMVSFYELSPSEEQIKTWHDSDFINKNQEFITSDLFSKYISSGTTDKNFVVSRIVEYKNFLSSL